jgi:hypothetical protein
MPIRRNAQVIGPDVQQTPMGFGNALLEGVQLYKQQQQARANALLNMRRQDEIERAQKAQEGRNAILDREALDQRAIENERAGSYLGMQQANTDINRQRFDRDLRNEDRLEVDRRRALEAQAQAAAESDRPDVARRLMEETGAVSNAPGRYQMDPIEIGRGGTVGPVTGQRVGDAPIEPGDPLKFTNDGREITLDPNAARNARAPRADALFSADSQDPRVQSAYKDTRNLFTETGDADKAAVLLERRLGDIARADSAAARAKKPGGGPRGPNKANFGADLSKDELMRALPIAESVLRHYEYDKKRGSYEKFKEIKSLLNDKTAAGDVIAGGTFAKEAQGGTGILTDADLRYFWEKIGGIGVRTESELSTALGGGMGDEKRKIVMQAVDNIFTRKNAELAAIEKPMREAMRRSIPRAEEWAVGTYFGDFQPAEPAAQPAVRPTNPVSNARAADADKNRARAQRANGDLSDDDFISQHGGK